MLFDYCLYDFGGNRQVAPQWLLVVDANILAFENTINAHLLSYNVIPLLCILINRNDEMLSQGQSLLWDRVHLYFKRGKIIIKKKVVRSD